MGSVSQSELVLVTRMPLAVISLHACSMAAMRSPTLLPRAMYAVCSTGLPVNTWLSPISWANNCPPLMVAALVAVGLVGLGLAELGKEYLLNFTSAASSPA